MPKTKPKKPSLTQIRKILKEAQFNPRETGPLSIVADVGDRDYYTLRAVEELMRAEGAKHRMIQAIQLICLAIADA